MKTKRLVGLFAAALLISGTINVSASDEANLPTGYWNIAEPYRYVIFASDGGSYIRVELFAPVADSANTFKARKFKVSIEVSNIDGESANIVKVTGNLNGVELEFDLYELKNAELYEREKEKVLRICEGVKSETKLSKIIKIQCNAVFDFVNALFGKGTDKKLFGEETNLTKCVDTFIRLSDELDKANAKEMDKINENIGKKTE